jgi:hypothetical protein
MEAMKKGVALFNPKICSQNGLENLVPKIKNMISPENGSPEFLCPEKPEPRILFAQIL